MYHYDDYLVHHGVKGMKWGVRRYENKDGSLTPAGLKRYGSEYEKASKAYRQAKTAYRKNPYSDKKLDRLEIARRNKKDALDRSKIQSKGAKSEKTKALEKKYKEKYNLTDQEAELRAYRNQRTKKMLAIAGGVAVTAAAVYIAKNHYENTVDKMIKPGQTLQNINKGGMDFTRSFYTSTNKSDNKKYQGLYGGGQLGGARGEKIIKSKLTVGSSGLKVASRKNGTDIFAKKMSEDPEFKKDVESVLSVWAKRAEGVPHPQSRALVKGYDNLKKGKVDKSVYDAFNIALVDKSDAGGRMQTSFYKKMREKGYDAIGDVNDKRYSGYNSKSPLIVFGNVKGDKISSVSEKTLSRKELQKSNSTETTKLLVRQSAKSGAKLAVAVTAASKLSSAARNRENASYVRQYRKEHPNSKLSENEIIQLKRKEERDGSV